MTDKPETLEGYDPAVAKKYAKRTCKVCFGTGETAHFLHGKAGKYRFERACWCAVSNFCDSRMALKAPTENKEVAG